MVQPFWVTASAERCLSACTVSLNFIIVDIWQTAPDNWTLTGTIKQNVRFQGEKWLKKLNLEMADMRLANIIDIIEINMRNNNAR